MSDLVVLLAHGSPDRRAAAATHDVARRLEQRLTGPVVRAAFLDHDWPSLPAAIGRHLDAGGADSVVVVPMLLSNAFHARSDVPGTVASARLAHRVDIVVTAPIGLDERLLDALEDALPADGPAVLAAAGTSDKRAQADLRALAASWQRRRGAQVVAAYAAQASPGVTAAITAVNASSAREPVVGTLLLFPGTLDDRVAIHAAGRSKSPPLCESAHLVEILADRVARAPACA